MRLKHLVVGVSMTLNVKRQAGKSKVTFEKPGLAEATVYEK